MNILFILDGKLRNRCARWEYSLLFDLFKAFDLFETLNYVIQWFESSHESDFFHPKRLIFLQACATCSELPSNISATVLNKLISDENLKQVSLWTRRRFVTSPDVM